jgi:hypothetical protein
MSVIKAGTTLTTAYTVEADTTGALEFKTGPSATLAMSISSSGVVTFPATTGFDIASANITNLTSSTATISNTLALSGGTANGVLYLNGSSVVTSSSAVVFDGANMGLGVTPSAWISSYRAFTLGYSSNGMFSGGNTQLGLTQNAFLDSGVSWRYTTSNPASQYIQSSGAHQWYTAASGTAGDPITFSTAMTLDASGNLGLGTSESVLSSCRRGYDQRIRRIYQHHSRRFVNSLG